ncbi:MAG: hypothetical protein OXC25_08605 [Thiotrichales bacterium]|nr:hypothetical protein [Thiotrichales bacterium]MCY4349896.1 hypothetical protein [Thiotrichales bacterium]
MKFVADSPLVPPAIDAVARTVDRIRHMKVISVILAMTVAPPRRTLRLDVEANP